MKLKILFFPALLLIIGFSSCLKTYTCECVTTYYTTYKTDSTKKEIAHFNGSRKAPVIQDCTRMNDSTKNALGTGMVRSCSITD